MKTDCVKMSVGCLAVYYFKDGNGWIRRFGVARTHSHVEDKDEIVVQHLSYLGGGHCLESLSDGAMTTRMRRVKTYKIEYVNKEEVLQKYFMKLL